MGIPNLADLQKKAAQLGLTVKQSGKRPAKEDYVQAFRSHYLPEGGLPYTELTPMLCFAMWNLREDEQYHVWKSPTWVVQRKLNGCRLIMHFVKGKGIYAHSRTVSLKTYRMQELTDQLLFGDFIPDFTATIDCEVIVEKPIDTRGFTAKGELTKTSLHSTTALLHLEAEASKRIQREQSAPLMVQAFDITNWLGDDTRKLSLARRLVRLEEFKETIQETEIGKYFQFPEAVAEDKETYFCHIIKEGGEGVILKNLNSTYEDSSSRPRDGWIKVKKRREYDAFVTGFIRGEKGTGWQNLVGALEFSVNLKNGGRHIIGYGTNVTLEQRKEMTEYDAATDTVKLKPEFYGRVAEISGQDISARELRLSHCTIDRWRNEEGADHKDQADCVVEMADLKAAAEWVG